MDRSGHADGQRFPALLVAGHFSRNELFENDGPPLRVKLLGEDLYGVPRYGCVIGLVDAFCPHRRAPMFFGRNEECGLRCVYHGWKFDRDGVCVDMPSEPPDSLFKSKVTIAAYPVERRTVWRIWSKELQPPCSTTTLSRPKRIALFRRHSRMQRAQREGLTDRTRPLCTT